MTATRAQVTRPTAGVYTPATPLKAPAIVHDVLRSHGRPLEPHVREEMEGRFGFDFSSVRIHTDSVAAQSARAVAARAYAVGPDIVFAHAQFAPETYSGHELLVHELVHVVQQGAKPPAVGGSLNVSRNADSSEREADAVATLSVVPPGALKRSEPLLARQPQPTQPCAFNCTDPAFLARPVPDREAQLNAQCPQGFPPGTTTFFSRTIPAVTRTLSTKLHEAESRAMRAMCLAGQDPSSFRLAGTIITYPGHSPGEDKAVDIDVTGQPYVMHEFTRQIPGDRTSPMVAEADIDREVGPVYDRIAFWSRYRSSIIPSGITRVTRSQGTQDTQRSWRNPASGQQESISTGQLYDLLKQESTGMQGYFDLLRKSDADLASEIGIFLMFNIEPPAGLTRRGLPIDDSSASVVAFRRRLADDYRLLGGTTTGLAALAGGPVTSSTPAAHLGDRPFVGRNPEQGFLTMPREVVVALTEVGLTWGAVDFGGQSGDVMHIDCRGLAGC
jgi:hypothetical protein